MQINGQKGIWQRETLLLWAINFQLNAVKRWENCKKKKKTLKFKIQQFEPLREGANSITQLNMPYLILLQPIK